MPRQASEMRAAASAQSSAFDVVSVKPSGQGTGVPIGFRELPDGIEANLTVRLLIRDAYGGLSEIPTDDSITGLPGWANTEYFTVRAKMNEAQVTEFKKLPPSERIQRLNTMLRSLLADQFKLEVHRQPKQVPDYDLVVTKDGPKFKPLDPHDPSARGGGGVIIPHPNDDFELRGFSMETLAIFLSTARVAGTGRIVKDKTGLTGTYNLKLNFLPAQPIFNRGPEGEASDPAPSIFTALQEQLGLKLQPSTGIIDVVVVDHVERPSVN